MQSLLKRQVNSRAAPNQGQMTAADPYLQCHAFALVGTVFLVLYNFTLYGNLVRIHWMSCMGQSSLGQPSQHCAIVEGMLSFLHQIASEPVVNPMHI
jgi:hypothetical protein